MICYVREGRRGVHELRESAHIAAAEEYASFPLCGYYGFNSTALITCIYMTIILKASFHGIVFTADIPIFLFAIS